jgi:hypothetical protein
MLPNVLRKREMMEVPPLRSLPVDSMLTTIVMVANLPCSDKMRFAALQALKNLPCSVKKNTPSERVTYYECHHEATQRSCRCANWPIPVWTALPDFVLVSSCPGLLLTVIFKPHDGSDLWGSGREGANGGD